jgi:hypothetical protein
MKILMFLSRLHRPAAGQRVARVVGTQLAALLVAVLVNPPPAALRDMHATSAAPLARDATPEEPR